MRQNTKFWVNDFLNTEPIITKINALYNNPRLRRGLLKSRWPLAILFSISLALLMKAQFFWFGLTLSIVGEALQVWCFAALHKKKELAANGPYAVVRNPMYLGRYLLILGAITITGRPFLMILFTIVYYFYMANRVDREEKVLEEIFKDDYRKYCRQVPRFLPLWHDSKKTNLRFFKWKLFFENNAHLNLLAMSIGYLLIYYMIRK